MQIETGIPIPRQRRNGTRSLSSALYTMKVGESVLVPEERGRALRTMASRISKETRRIYTTRTTEEGVRVWRIG